MRLRRIAYSTAGLFACVGLIMGFTKGVLASYDPGWVHAVCIDQCQDLGSSANCTTTTTCTWGYPTCPPEGTDFYTCNKLYMDAGTPGVEILMCSPSPTANCIICSEQIVGGPNKSCGSITACFCIDDPQGDHCAIDTWADRLDQDDCWTN